jgi:hypothetical protein
MKDSMRKRFMKFLIGLALVVAVGLVIWRFGETWLNALLSWRAGYKIK